MRDLPRAGARQPPCNVNSAVSPFRSMPNTCFETAESTLEHELANRRVAATADCGRVDGQVPSTPSNVNSAVSLFRLMRNTHFESGVGEPSSAAMPPKVSRGVAAGTIGRLLLGACALRSRREPENGWTDGQLSRDGRRQ